MDWHVVGTTKRFQCAVTEQLWLALLHHHYHHHDDDYYSYCRDGITGGDQD